jgi:polyisoprenyl-phosphate glycosyltransferase
MTNQSEKAVFRLSLVVPMYNEAEACEAFFKRVLPIIGGITADFEIICVNDGSCDTTLDLLRVARTREPRIKIVNLTRNFGKEMALTAGIDYASGDAVIPLDVDLQDPPEIIPELVAKWHDGYEMVVAVRGDRSSDIFLKRLTRLL